MRWQEIPSVVEVRDGQAVRKQPLSERFQALIDHAAMVRDLAGSDAYLEGWRADEEQVRPGNAEQVLAQVVAEIEDRFVEFRDGVNRPART